jgi:hypothetical protein
VITDSEILQLRKEIYLALVAKSGLREWENAEASESLWLAAIDAADGLLGIVEPEPGTGGSVALPDYFRVSSGTAKTIKNSGGDAAITLASLANGNGTSAGGRQAATLDLGEKWAQLWVISTEFELAATPTAGNAINLWASFTDATGAGGANTSGTDSAYSGYSNNIDAATKQLDWIGAHICTAQATATVQKMPVAGVFMPKARYLNLVVDNRSGAAFHSTDTNQLIKLKPLNESVEDTI